MTNSLICRLFFVLVIPVVAIAATASSANELGDQPGLQLGAASDPRTTQRKQQVSPPNEVLDNQYDDAFIARVVEVLSGDQVVMLLPSGTELKAKLAGLRAPPEDSAFYQQSRSWLRSQLQGQLVSAECKKSHGVLECVIFPDDRQINVVSLYHGLSTCDGQGSVLHGAAYYKKFEKMAQANKSGLWSTQ